jgi:hypothetical protein
LRDGAGVTKQLSGDDLVPLAVVGHVDEIGRGPLPAGGVHVHTIDTSSPE